MTATLDQPAAESAPAPEAREKKTEKKHRRKRTWRGIFFTAFLFFLVLAVIGRLMLPWAVRSYVNRTIDQDPRYDGKIGDV